MPPATHPPTPRTSTLSNTVKFAQYKVNLNFVGVLGRLDPPKIEYSPTIKLCKQAGIRIIMNTGNNKNTAKAICRRIGRFTEDKCT